MPLLILLIYGLDFRRVNFDARCEAYINAMKVIFRQIPQFFLIALTPKEKIQKLLTDIGGGWYMEMWEAA